MKIIKLSQKAVITRHVDSIIGFEEEVICEPIYVVAEHIESFSWAGNTYLKMASGERIEVSETAEQVIDLINGDDSVGSLETWKKLGGAA